MTLDLDLWERTTTTPSVSLVGACVPRACSEFFLGKMIMNRGIAVLLSLTSYCAVVIAAPEWRPAEERADRLANTKFLEDNEADPEVTTLPSGLQYKVLASGPVDGKSPGYSAPCVCHYAGKLIDGSEFDSSRKRGKPATFSPSGVVAGWTEALQLMRPGDRWELVLPAKLAYGERGAGGGRIPGGAALVFDLELLEVKEGGGGIIDLLSTPLIGGMPAWSLILMVVYVAFRLGAFGGGGGGKSVAASHILIKGDNASQRCDELKSELEKLKSKGFDAVKARFEEMAKAESTCPSKSKGGALGTFGPGQMVPAFDKVCWAAPVGEVQGPVDTQFGSHLILVTERDDGAKAE